MYALGLNITKKACVAQGQTDEEGKKFAKYDDVVEKCKAAVATPDSQGTYNDYLELLKLYDKNSNGTMMLAELDSAVMPGGRVTPTASSHQLSNHYENLFAHNLDLPTSANNQNHDNHPVAL